MRVTNQTVEEVLAAALTCSRRGGFVRRYVLVLWPGVEMMLQEMARWLGGEVRLPGDPMPLLARSLAAGADCFFRCRGRYNPATWDHGVFLHFHQGLFRQGAEIYRCQARVLGEVWEARREPFMDWRQGRPGRLEVVWREHGVADDPARQLARQVISAAGYPRVWVVERLEELLGQLPRPEGRSLRELLVGRPQPGPF